MKVTLEDFTRGAKHLATVGRIREHFIECIEKSKKKKANFSMKVSFQATSRKELYEICHKARHAIDCAWDNVEIDGDCYYSVYALSYKDGIYKQHISIHFEIEDDGK
jgi:hypothetical protein